LPLLVLGIALADDANDALSLDDFAVLADRLDAGTNLHSKAPDRLRASLAIYRGWIGHASEGARWA
jgi:hypothetical protein